MIEICKFDHLIAYQLYWLFRSVSLT